MSPQAQRSKILTVLTHKQAQQSINAKDVTKRDHFAFGAGRRICPGYHVAERSFVTTLMRMLWCFNITAKEGVEVPLKDGKSPGTSHTSRNAYV
jgi:cytochrome P450